MWLRGNPIRWVKTTKILGMTLDDNMKCKDHVEELVLNYAKEVNSPKVDAFSSMRHACLRTFIGKSSMVTHGIELWGIKL